MTYPLQAASVRPGGPAPTTLDRPAISPPRVSLSSGSTARTGRPAALSQGTVAAVQQQDDAGTQRVGLSQRCGGAFVELFDLGGQLQSQPGFDRDVFDEVGMVQFALRGRRSLPVPSMMNILPWARRLQILNVRQNGSGPTSLRPSYELETVA
jgi:hypothetical protein